MLYFYILENLDLGRTYKFDNSLWKIVGTNNRYALSMLS